MQKTNLQWDPTTTNTNGTAVNGPVTYTVLYGTQSGVYTKTVKGFTTTTAPLATVFSNAADGLYFVTVEAVDIFGVASANANEVQVLKSGTNFFVQQPGEVPAAPANLVLV